MLNGHIRTTALPSINTYYHVGQIRLYKVSQGGALPILPDLRPWCSYKVVSPTSISNDEEEQPTYTNHAEGSAEYRADGICEI